MLLNYIPTGIISQKIILNSFYHQKNPGNSWKIVFAILKIHRLHRKLSNAYLTRFLVFPHELDLSGALVPDIIHGMKFS
jgi:hypothetical protein